MAKSKNGGTRALIRGRVGSDVYSVGKNAAGQRQQIVRSLAESVANPRTEQQMFGRMVMSTVMQAVSALKPIIDHSFDGLPAGQPSISEFIRRNYQLVKADAIGNPSYDNKFGLVKYQEKGVKLGNYQISNGSAALPSIVSLPDTIMIISLPAGGSTVGDLRAALGLSASGYLTGVAITLAHGARYARVKLNADAADQTVISSENVATLFTVEANFDAAVTFASNSVRIEMTESSDTVAGAVIVSELLNGTWIHNTAVLQGASDADFSSSEALPTYPLGDQMFLNGGEL